MLSLREKHEYEQEIDWLKSQLVTARALQSYYKVKYDKLDGAIVKPVDNRMANAIPLIKIRMNGDKSLSYNDIAIKCFIAIGTVRNAASKIRIDAACKRKSLELTGGLI